MLFAGFVFCLVFWFGFVLIFALVDCFVLFGILILCFLFCLLIWISFLFCFFLSVVMVLIYHAILRLVPYLIIFSILYVSKYFIWLHFHIFSGVFEEN